MQPQTALSSCEICITRLCGAPRVRPQLLGSELLCTRQGYLHWASGECTDFAWAWEGVRGLEGAGQSSVDSVAIELAAAPVAVAETALTFAAAAGTAAAAAGPLASAAAASCFDLG